MSDIQDTTTDAAVDVVTTPVAPDTAITASEPVVDTTTVVTEPMVEVEIPTPIVADSVVEVIVPTDVIEPISHDHTAEFTKITGGSDYDVTEATDVQLGKNLCPNNVDGSKALEDALTLLRTPEPVNRDQLGDAQHVIYVYLTRYLVNAVDVDTFKFLDNILEYIYFNMAKQFTPELKFRGVEYLTTLTAKQFAEFSILWSILIDAADVNTRKHVVNSVAWDVVRDELVPLYADTVISKLTRYFNVQ